MRFLFIESVFFPDGCGTHTPESKLVKGLGGSDRQFFLSSAQCTEAANMAKRLIFMIRRSFHDLFEIVFHPFYGALVRPYLQFGISACSPNLVADINP